MTPEQIKFIRDLPSIEDVLASPSVDQWVKNALLIALKKDIVDAANGAELVAMLLTRKCDLALRGDKSPFSKAVES